MVVQFIFNVPGYYTGRTNHFTVSASRLLFITAEINRLSVMAFTDAKKHLNNTLTGGSVARVAQVYFDQALIDAVETTFPYNTNKDPKMKNSADYLMATGAKNGQGPISEYVLLGTKVEDGILAWLNYGIDPNANYLISPASHCYEKGCVNDPKGGLTGMFGGHGFIWERGNIKRVKGAG
jgi:hypothetical protein